MKASKKKKKRMGETWQSRAGLHILVLPGTRFLQKIANYLLHREPRIYIFWIFHVNGIIIYYLLCLFSVISYNVLKYMFYHVTILHSFPWLNNVSIFESLIVVIYLFIYISIYLAFLTALISFLFLPNDLIFFLTSSILVLGISDSGKSTGFLLRHV